MPKSLGGRPTKEPTTVINVPINKIKRVEKILKKKITTEQTPTIKVRVPSSLVKKIRDEIKGNE